MMLDLHNDVEIRRVISPSRTTDNTPLVGQIIDHANRFACEYIIATGTLADVDATFTVLLEEGDQSDLSDAAAVADAHLLGTESGASFTFTNDNVVRKLGYIGSKRYTRMTITPANNTGNADISAVAALAHARKLPRSSQAA